MAEVEKSAERKCANPECRAKITQCFGFVLCRDFLALVAGSIAASDIRELCGKCALRFQDPTSPLQPTHPLRIEEIETWR